MLTVLVRLFCESSREGGGVVRSADPGKSLGPVAASAPGSSLGPVASADPGMSLGPSRRCRSGLFIGSRFHGVVDPGQRRHATCSSLPADPRSAGPGDPRLAAVASLVAPRVAAASPCGASLAVAQVACGVLPLLPRGPGRKWREVRPSAFAPGAICTSRPCFSHERRRALPSRLFGSPTVRPAARASARGCRWWAPASSGVERAG